MDTDYIITPQGRTRNITKPTKQQYQVKKKDLPRPEQEAINENPKAPAPITQLQTTLVSEIQTSQPILEHQIECQSLKPHSKSSKSQHDNGKHSTVENPSEPSEEIELNSDIGKTREMPAQAEGHLYEEGELKRKILETAESMYKIIKEYDGPDIYISFGAELVGRLIQEGQLTNTCTQLEFQGWVETVTKLTKLVFITINNFDHKFPKTFHKCKRPCQK